MAHRERYPVTTGIAAFITYIFWWIASSIIFYGISYVFTLWLGEINHFSGELFFSLHIKEYIVAAAAAGLVFVIVDAK
jgi:hypothetical protein